MGSLNLFSQNIYFVITLFSLGLLFCAALFAGRADKIGASIWLLFFALLIDFAATGLEYEITDLYNRGVSITLYVLVELILFLVSMIFMYLSASQFLIHGYPAKYITAAVSSLGLFAIGFFVLFLPDGNMVNNMRQIFPLAGFTYIAVSLWSETKQKNNGGYILAALTTTFVAIFLAMRMFGEGIIQTSDYWFLSPVAYSLLSISMVMMYADRVSDKLVKTAGEVNKYNQRIQDIIKSSPFPIIISRLTDDKIILANSNAVKLFGINPNELERYRLKDFFADSENRRLLNERLEQERVVQDFEILVKTPINDTPFWLLASANVIDYNYDVVLYAAFQDITSRKNREALLKNQATRDPLTSLYNRRYFEDEVTKQILKAKSENQPYTVLMIDADLFKRVNDTYGHKIGDKVLIELASTSERALRDKDIVARYGGEEFVVFLPNINAVQGRIVADRLRESIASVVVYSDDNQPVTFTVSIGVSSSEISDNIDTLIKTADEALYKAKQNGRNRVEVFSRSDLAQFIKQGQIERKDESHHPIFDKENNMEISLLDGVETSKLQNEKTFVEEPAKKIIPLGIDKEDM